MRQKEFSLTSYAKHGTKCERGTKVKYLGQIIFCLGFGLAFLPIRSSAYDPNFKFHDYDQTGSSASAPAPAPAPVAPSPVATDNSTDPKDQISATPYSPPPPPLRVETRLRSDYGIGSNITLYGGVTAFQEGTLKVTSPGAPGAEVRGDTHSIVGEVAGLKIGYTWASFAAIGARPESPALTTPELIEPSVSMDFFWSGYRYTASGAGTTSSGGVTGNYNGTLRADVDTYTGCVEPSIKFNLGAFRPYLGFGVGGTYAEASRANVTGNASVLNLTATGSQNLTGSSSDVDFTFEGLAGVEFFIARHWALNLDYKFVYFVNPTFHGDVPGSTVNYHLAGLGESMFTGGISYYF
jgi:outer membrane protein with beta-barrel domain